MTSYKMGLIINSYQTWIITRVILNWSGWVSLPTRHLTQHLTVFWKVIEAFLRADPPLQVVFSSLKSPQSLSPSQAQWSGIQRPLVHLKWVLAQDWMQPTSSLPSPQSSSVHMHKLSWKRADYMWWWYEQSLISMMSIFKKVLVLTWITMPVRTDASPVGAAELGEGLTGGEGWKGLIQVHIKYKPNPS